MAMITTAREGRKRLYPTTEIVFAWGKDKHLPPVEPPTRGERVLRSPMKRKRDTTLIEDLE